MFGLSGIKLIIIAVATTVLIATMGTLIYNYNKNLKLAAILKHQNAQLEENIKAKEAEIEFMEELQLVNDNALIERDRVIEDLETQLEGINEDLGDDAQEQVPNSVKEVIRRLRGTSQ
jgi:hypothetical protein